MGCLPGKAVRGGFSMFFYVFLCFFYVFSMFFYVFLLFFYVFLCFSIVFFCFFCFFLVFSMVFLEKAPGDPPKPLIIFKLRSFHPGCDAEAVVTAVDVG